MPTPWKWCSIGWQPGLIPNQATLVLQSAVPEHTQLSVLLSMLATVARLERVPTYKDQIRELGLNPFVGLPDLPCPPGLRYPALPGRYTVPVGEDQLPHLELARELARRFNQLYGELFPEPQPLLSSHPRLPGIDNRTMHASYGNAIYLKDSPETTTQKVMGMYTDPTRLRATDPGHVEGNPVFEYLEIFAPNPEEVAELKTRYQTGKIGDVALKQRLAQVLNEYLAPIRERRAVLASRPDQVLEMLQSGTARARPIARATLEAAQARMGLTAGLELNEDISPIILTGTYC